MPSQGDIVKGNATTDAKGKYKIEGIAFGTTTLWTRLTGASPSDIKKVKVAQVLLNPFDLELK